MWTNLLNWGLAAAGAERAIYVYPRLSCQERGSSPRHLRTRLPGGLLVWGEYSSPPSWEHTLCRWEGSQPYNHVNFRPAQADWEGQEVTQLIPRPHFQFFTSLAWPPLLYFLPLTSERFPFYQKSFGNDALGNVSKQVFILIKTLLNTKK